MSELRATLRGAVVIDRMQPQFAAIVAASSEGFFPVEGESAFWLEVCPGIVVTSLLDRALKACDVRPGALVTERLYGTLEVHGPDQGMVRQAADACLACIGGRIEDALRPKVLTSEIVRQIDPHQAMLLNRQRQGMLVLGRDTLYTLEVSPAVYAVLAANEAEKRSPVRLVGLESEGAVGRLRLAGTDAEIEQAVEAVRIALEAVPGRAHPEEVR